MTTQRHALSDSQWDAIKHLFPDRESSNGRPRANQRLMFEGVVWCLKAGTPWRDLHERFGPWQTVYKHFADWRDDGKLEIVKDVLQLMIHERELLDRTLWSIDGTSIRAAHAAVGGGKKGA